MKKDKTEKKYGNAPHASPAQKDVLEGELAMDWDSYLMSLAVAVSKKSKDPKCKVGAVITRDEHVPVITGFNGFARHLRDDKDLLSDVDEKLKWICHAEFNAIMNAARFGVPLAGTKIYVTKFPCFACCNAIIQAGIKAIHTDDKKFWDDDPVDSDHSRKIAALAQAGIAVTAPNHPHFSPKPRGRKSEGTALQLTEPPKKSKPKARRSSAKKASKKTDNMSLFPARQPISGGKSES